MAVVQGDLVTQIGGGGTQSSLEGPKIASILQAAQTSINVRVTTKLSCSRHVSWGRPLVIRKRKTKREKKPEVALTEVPRKEIH